MTKNAIVTKLKVLETLYVVANIKKELSVLKLTNNK